MTHPHDPQQMVDDLPLKPLSACQDDPCIWDRFFALRSVGELRHFADNLDPFTPDHVALARYMTTWTSYRVQDASDVFDPQAHVSQDLSTALYADCPCIFRGSNAWSIASVMQAGAHLARLAALSRRIGEVRVANPDATFIVAIIPEKDFVLNRLFIRDGRLDSLAESANAFQRMLQDEGISVIFDDFLDGLARYQTSHDYNYPDSHLPTANYLQVMSHVMRLTCIPWNRLRDRLRIVTGNEYCDLNDRLTGLAPNPVRFPMPEILSAGVFLTDGDESFSTPLGETRQILHNNHPSDDRSLLILGDSHSSIYSKKKLTYLCANVYQTTEFRWNPCGFRAVVGTTPHSIILMEVAQRFLYSVQ